MRNMKLYVLIDAVYAYIRSTPSLHAAPNQHVVGFPTVEEILMPRPGGKAASIVDASRSATDRR